MKKYIYILGLLSLISCKKESNTVDFIFLQVNDVYEIDALEGGKVGGMDRVETLHKQLLAENSNTFLVMAGDFLNPSLLGTIKHQGERIAGKQMIEVMNAMNFDLVAFGNHEFDIKQKYFQKRLDESNFQWIATNEMYVLDSVKQSFFKQQDNARKTIPKTVTFKIKNKDGKEISIGFFSATINSNPKDYIDYGDFYQDAQNAYNHLKINNEIVFGLTHLKLSQDKLLANMLTEVPLIMGGHEHVHKDVLVGNVVIRKADANAKTAYVHRVSYDLGSKKTKVQSTLVAIDSSFKKDTAVRKIINKWNVLLDAKIKEILPNPEEIIYTAREPLDGRDTPIREKQTNLGEVVAKGMAFAFDNKVDCALVNGGSIRLDDQLQGAITGIDIFRVLPFGGGVLKVDLKGSLLEKVLQYGRLKSGTGAYLQRYNASYDKANKKWLVQGKRINHNKIYTVAFSDYLLKGYDIPFLKPTNKDVLKVYINTEDVMASDIRKSVINYLKTKN